jgi:hypothetical protein
MSTKQIIEKQLSKRTMKEISKQHVQNIDDYMFEKSKLSDLNNNQLVHAINILKDNDPYIRRKKFKKPHSNDLIQPVEYDNILARLIFYQRRESVREPPPSQSKKQRANTPSPKGGKYKRKSRKRSKKSKRSKRSQKIQY